MNLSNKRKYTNFLVLCLLLSPLLALGAEADYLYVTGRYEAGKLNIHFVEQRVFDTDTIVINQNGTYEMRLVQDSRLISNNFFEIVEDLEMEALTEEGRPSQFTPEFIMFTVALPLTASVESEKADIQILKGGQVLATSKLSQLPFEALGLKANEVSIQKPEPVFPPFPAFKEKGGLSKLLWPSIALIGFVLLIVLVVIIIKARKNKPPSPVQSTPSNQELTNYISQSRAAGQTDQEIKQALVSAGWPEDAVDRVLTSG